MPVMSVILDKLSDTSKLNLRSGEPTPLAEAFGINPEAISGLPQHIKVAMARAVATMTQ